MINSVDICKISGYGFAESLNACKKIATEISQISSDLQVAAQEICADNLDKDSFLRFRDRIISSNNVDIQVIEYLPSFICAYAICTSPTLETWKSIKRLQHYSNEAAEYLPPACLAILEIYPNNISRFLDLMCCITDELNSCSINSLSSRVNEERESFINSWPLYFDKLSELFDGLRGNYLLSYSEDWHVFQLLFLLDSKTYFATVHKISNPSLVLSMLVAAGISPFKFNSEPFQFHILSALPAFESSGMWNGSLHIPLLLAEFRLTLSQLYLRSVAGNDVDESWNNIPTLIQDTFSMLLDRSDGLPCLSRWSSWLMHRIAKHDVSDLYDSNSIAKFDYLLLSTLEKCIGERGGNLLDYSHEVMLPWEKVSGFMTKVDFAHSGYGSYPDFEDFLGDWNLDIDEWDGPKGIELIRIFTPYTISSKNFTSVSATIMAIAILNSSDPLKSWDELVVSSAPLRELLEFDAFTGDSNSSTSSLDAGNILIFIFSIGLSIFDQNILLCKNPSSEISRNMCEMHYQLFNYVREMLGIERYVNLNTWNIAFQHIGIRRIIWQDGFSKSIEGMNPSIFLTEDKPTICDYLTFLKSNSIALLNFLDSLLSNYQKIDFLKKEIQNAGIDINSEISFVQSLQNINDRKYSFPTNKLHKIKSTFS